MFVLVLTFQKAMDIRLLRKGGDVKSQIIVLLEDKSNIV